MLRLPIKTWYSLVAAAPEGDADAAVPVPRSSVSVVFSLRRSSTQKVFKIPGKAVSICSEEELRPKGSVSVASSRLARLVNEQISKYQESLVTGRFSR